VRKKKLAGDHQIPVEFTYVNNKKMIKNMEISYVNQKKLNYLGRYGKEL
jgi:hypothetical protein